MDIKSKLGEDLKEAMRARDKLRLETVRSIRGAITNREVDSGESLDEAGVLGVIRSLAKQRADSIEQYAQGGRQDLADAERAEKAILESYLPAAPDAAAVEAAVQAAVAELGASGMKDMGRVMKACMERLGPAADGKMVSAAVRAVLSA